MAKDLLNRYIWIIDTIRRYGRISRRELNECWSRSPYSEGERTIPRRTFFNYRQAIEELFSVQIECDSSTYEYYIVEPDQRNITDWLLNASATSSVLQNSRDLASKILLEDVPSARQHLVPTMEALRNNQQMRFDYHPYNRSKPSIGVVIEPYFLRIYKQLWYVTGRNVADGKVKTYALDRIRELTTLSETFTPPLDADPKIYFRDSYGIVVDRSEPKSVTLKVDSRQAKYFRALPLHPSQEEMIHDKYSIFTLHLRITQDFVAQLLSYGPAVTVQSPPELRAMMLTSLRSSLDNYTSSTD